ncbi:expressed unknown protein [Seminavis robusta]|uniref:PDZ domain-containing protein n=1 Tax=Seminavis robusta TaxID=568900 RepID=A0A9N8H9V9_9STRA|nr:expressed unknown protein [Seminavis robusta]|eukprot:Sro128_g061300.1 n/a (344) ;mRNA; r:77454-78485
MSLSFGDCRDEKPEKVSVQCCVGDERRMDGPTKISELPEERMECESTPDNGGSTGTGTGASSIIGDNDGESSVESSPCTCSSLTVVSEGEETSSREVIGVSYLHDDDDDETTSNEDSEPSSQRSLDLSVDTPEIESVGRDIAIVGKLLFRDEFPSDFGDFTPSDIQGSGLPRLNHQTSLCLEEIDPVPIEEFIRDIFFVPVSRFCSREKCHGHINKSEELRTPSNIIFGLRFRDASCPVTHPTVSEVSNTSPLLGRVFQGDIILQVNDTKLLGFRAEEVVALFDKTTPTRDEERDDGQSFDCLDAFEHQVIKLTVMSCHSEDMSYLDDDEEDDTGVPGTGVEF